MIDELAHAAAEHLGPAFVAAYDRKQGYPDPAADLAAFDAHGRTEFSTFRWRLEPMLAAAGFEIVSTDFDRGLYGAYTCIRSR
jgi:hypothetical protein